MGNGKTLREQMGYVRSQGEEHGKKLDRIDEKIDKHEHSSSKYREQQATNTETIKNIKEISLPLMLKLIIAGYVLSGSIVSLLIKSMFFSSK